MNKNKWNDFQQIVESVGSFTLADTKNNIIWLHYYDMHGEQDAVYCLIINTKYYFYLSETNKGKNENENKINKFKCTF